MRPESSGKASNGGSGDLGLEVVARLRDSLQIDDEWCQEEERGFRWWPAQQAQQIWSEPALDDGGITVWRIHMRTDLLRDFGHAPEELDWLQESQIDTGALSGPVVEGPKSDRLRLAASAWIHEENAEWVEWLLAWEGVLQIAEARGWASAAGEEGIGTVDRSAHPVSGSRPLPDDMLQAYKTLVMPGGSLASPWLGEEMTWALEVVQQTPTVLATGGPTGLTAEFPFQGQTSLLRLLPEWEHSVLGTGLLVSLTIPVNETDMPIALALNKRELEEHTRSQFLGSWIPDQYGLSWRAFYPNVVWQAGLAANAAVGTVARARWVAESVFDDNWSETFEAARDAVLARTRAMAEAFRGDE